MKYRWTIAPSQPALAEFLAKALKISPPCSRGPQSIPSLFLLRSCAVCKLSPVRAVSSVVEHYLDTVGVTGSNPVSRTISSILRRLQFPAVIRAGDSSASLQCCAGPFRWSPDQIVWSGRLRSEYRRRKSRRGWRKSSALSDLLVGKMPALPGSWVRGPAARRGILLGSAATPGFAFHSFAHSLQEEGESCA